uniref:Carboxyvinyl-carboxyphosphonate phosphorylmutase n=1 Tax=Eutreptiella gymnastica TaxID=73025 RepID=A0A7S1NN42_9EUGL
MNAARLRALLKCGDILVMPCCYDALSAKLIQSAGFPLTFMSGFSTSAALLGLPDTGQASYTDFVQVGRNICSVVKIPVIGDGDTGFGNTISLKRTVKGYAAAGFAAIMLEDQVSPKRCGHVAGKQIVGREEAAARIRAAVDARNELEDSDILILARTDARIESFDEAIARCQMFADLGADITFLEAPESEAEMERYCQLVPGYKLANMLEHGKTPILDHKRLQEMGYSIAAYPLTLLSASIKAQLDVLQSIKEGGTGHLDKILPFEEVKRHVGFPEYFEEEKRYAVPGPPKAS